MVVPRLAALGEDTVAVPTRITLSTGAFLTHEVNTLEETTLSPERVTRDVVSSTPFSPSVSTFSWPLGRLEVSLRTSLKAISVSVVSTVVLARSMEMTVDSVTL